jgi:hypothetical protein
LGIDKKEAKYEIIGAKARNFEDINCPVRQLADGAIEKQSVPGLLPQASLRGAQNHQF